MTRPGWVVVAFASMVHAAHGDDLVYRSPELGWACPVEDAQDRDVGLIDDPMSSLRGSEVWVSGGVARATVDQRDQGHRPLGVGVRYAGDYLTVSLDGTAATAEPVAADGAIGPEHETSVANLRAGVGVRALSTQMGGIYRRGLALRTSVGIDIHSRTALQTSWALAGAWPWQRTRYAPGQYLETAVEARYELAGCHKPFLHFNVTSVMSKDFVDRAYAVGVTTGALNRIRTSLAFGITVGYDLALAHVPIVDPTNVARRNSDLTLVHRVRIGLWLPQMGSKFVNLGLLYTTQFGASRAYEVTATWWLPLTWGLDP